jgi:hypothetical protein
MTGRSSTLIEPLELGAGGRGDRAFERPALPAYQKDAVVLLRVAFIRQHGDVGTLRSPPSS